MKIPIVRTGTDSLECYYITESGDTDCVTFGGISDMTVFNIIDGDKTYTAADLPFQSQITEIDLLQLALVEQYEENLKLKESLTAVELALVELYERSI